MQADAMFFGLIGNQDKKEALKLYEESESYGNSKATLAIGSIYEKGLINEKLENGGIINMGAIERSSAEPDFMKAFDQYDYASNFEPYAILKSGEFLERGLLDLQPFYTEAFKLYRKAAQHESGCRQALFK